MEKVTDIRMVTRQESRRRGRVIFLGERTNPILAYTSFKKLRKEHSQVEEMSVNSFVCAIW